MSNLVRTPKDRAPYDAAHNTVHIILFMESNISSLKGIELGHS